MSEKQVERERFDPEKVRRINRDDAAAWVRDEDYDKLLALYRAASTPEAAGRSQDPPCKFCGAVIGERTLLEKYRVKHKECVDLTGHPDSLKSMAKDWRCDLCKEADMYSVPPPTERSIRCDHWCAPEFLLSEFQCVLEKGHEEEHSGGGATWGSGSRYDVYRPAPPSAEQAAVPETKD